MSTFSLRLFFRLVMMPWNLLLSGSHTHKAKNRTHPYNMTVYSCYWINSLGLHLELTLQDFQFILDDIFKRDLQPKIGVSSFSCNWWKNNEFGWKQKLETQSSTEICDKAGCNMNIIVKSILFICKEVRSLSLRFSRKWSMVINQPRYHKKQPDAGSGMWTVEKNTQEHIQL